MVQYESSNLELMFKRNSELCLSSIVLALRPKNSHIEQTSFRIPSLINHAHNIVSLAVLSVGVPEKV